MGPRGASERPERQQNPQNESSRGGGGRHRMPLDQRPRARLGSPALMKEISSARQVGPGKDRAQPLYISKSCPEALKYKASWSINDFTMEELIANGESWSMHQGVLNAAAGKVLVTVKVHHREHLKPSTRQRIEAEIAASTAICNSPRILQLYGIFEGEGGIYMVHQHCKGFCPLHLAIGRQPDEKRVRAVAAGVLRSLADIHCQDITHNNVKPHNVLIDDKGSVKLMNFENAVVSSAGNTLRPTSQPLPSLRSKAPVVVPADDISDLGVMVWELMLERIDEASPFQGPRLATRASSRGVKRSGPLSCWRASQNLRHFVSVATALSARMRPDAKALLQHKWLTGVEESLVSPTGSMSLPTFDHVRSRTATGDSSRQLRLGKPEPREQVSMTNLSLVAADSDSGRPTGWFDVRPPSSMALLASDRGIRTPVLTPFRRPGASGTGESSSVPILPIHQLGPQASSRLLLAVDSSRSLPTLSSPLYPKQRRNKLFFAYHPTPVPAS